MIIPIHFRAFYFGVLCSLPSLSYAADATISFNRDIRPILSRNCLACHGFDAEKRKADLRLDLPEFSTIPNKEGDTAIVPGNPEASTLWQRINATDADEIMPPATSHKILSDKDKQTFRKWIEEGAVYQKHWAFESIAQPTPPANGAPNQIDAFLRGQLASESLTPMTEADKNTLIRRVSFTLTGLPPTPQEIDTYVNDASETAYLSMVDRYLASPHYGEEMARHWLDVARYGDTHGLHLDNARDIWPYRDWVVKSFNKNQAFDEFTIDQIAGDQLPNPTIDQKVATGFIRCNATTSEGGSIDEEVLNRYAVERASTTMQTWLGLTGGCAVCHDHKFDPITAKDFYSMYAFFYSNADPAMDGNAQNTSPSLLVETPEIISQRATVKATADSALVAFNQAVAAFLYADPADSALAQQDNPVTHTYQDDAFPTGAAIKGDTAPEIFRFITKAEGPVKIGEKALLGEPAGLAQIYYDSGAAPLPIPSSGNFHVSVFIDSKNPPKAFMIQLNSGAWKHRILWGDPSSIPYGTEGTHDKIVAGPLPEAGKWVTLEFKAETLGLTPESKVAGFAFTQAGGRVAWDDFGISGISNPAKDPLISFKAWWSIKETAPDTTIAAPVQAILTAGQTQATAEQKQQVLEWFLENVHPPSIAAFGPAKTTKDAAAAAVTALEASIPSTLVFNDLPEPRQAHVKLRGDYASPGEPVEPMTPGFLPPLQKSGPRATRLDLARWLVAPENPLTARVTVNRFWQQIFGVGLVKTSGDLGSQGETPSHPELLDWLATDFKQNKWDVKRLMRQILYTQAFRQSSEAQPALWTRDPENRLLARGPRIRLGAEQIRDNALFTSGLLNLQMGGAGVKTYQPENIWEVIAYTDSNTRFYQQDKGDKLYRRSLYTYLKRTAPPPFMANFDAPSREDFCARRDTSNTPLQALQLMNDTQQVEAARFLAERLLQEGGTTPEARIDYAWKLTLARTPTPEERAIVLHQLQLQTANFAATPDDATKLLTVGEKPSNPALNHQELAAWTMVANMILNLDETITRN